MLVLAFDTSTLSSSVGWFEVDASTPQATVTRFSQRIDRARPGHAETLLPLLVAELNKGGYSCSDVDLIVFGKGPGTFTGLRIGMSTVKGLFLAHQTPAVCMSSLEALAISCQTDGLIAPLIDARRGELYYGLYRILLQGELPIATPVIDGQVGPVAEVLGQLTEQRGDAPLTLTGNGIGAHHRQIVETFPDGVTLLEERQGAPDTYWMARLGAIRFGERGPDDLEHAEPLYLRKPDAKLPGSKRTAD